MSMCNAHAYPSGMTFTFTKIAFCFYVCVNNGNNEENGLTEQPR